MLYALCYPLKANCGKRMNGSLVSFEDNRSTELMHVGLLVIFVVSFWANKYLVKAAKRYSV
jgi:hypothetical protein